jgi:plasmid stabilization system protein ParE
MEKETESTRKKYNLELSVFALQNIDEIIAYIAFVNHQPINAKKVGDKIFETIDRIQQTPFQFKSCEELPAKSKMYRKAICLSWLIIYKVVKTEIRILGIIHTSRNPSIIKSLRKVL